MPEVRRNSDKILKIASQNHWLKKSQIKKNNNKKFKKHNKTKKKTTTTDGRKPMSACIMSFHHIYFNRDCNETYPINENLSCDTENC